MSDTLRIINRHGIPHTIPADLWPVAKAQGARQAEEEEAPPPAPAAPFPDYDSLNVEQVQARLGGLSAEQLAAVAAYEAANKNRRTVLEAVDAAG